MTVEGQIRGDWYSETQLDWSGRLTTLYTLNEERKRILRFSAAKAFRAPLMTQREGQKHAGTHYAGGYWFNIIAPDDLKNEETWSLEAGYSEQLASWLTFRTDFYYQRFERLIGDKNLTDTTWPYNRTLETLDNLGGADSYGCEVEFKAKAKAGEFSLWYALNEFQQSRNNTQVDAYLPAPHKAGATARLYLPYDSVLNMNYRFTSATSGKDADLTIYTNPCVSHRFDISLAKKLGSSNGELMLGVSDLFNRTNDPVEDTWKHPTPGRTFFVRLQLKF